MEYIIYCHLLASSLKTRAVEVPGTCERMHQYSRHQVPGTFQSRTV